MAEVKGVWEVRLGIHCTRQQAEEIKERIVHLLCPDPAHAAPCPVPWSVSLADLSGPEDADDYPESVEQARIEDRGHRPRQARLQALPPRSTRLRGAAVHRDPRPGGDPFSGGTKCVAEASVCALSASPLIGWIKVTFRPRL